MRQGMDAEVEEGVVCLVNVADKLGEREGSTRVKVGKGCYYLERLGDFGLRMSGLRWAWIRWACFGVG